MFYIKLASYFITIYILSLFLLKLEKKNIDYLRKPFLLIFGFYGFLNIVSYFTKDSYVNIDIITNLLDITTIKQGFEGFFIQSISIVLITVLYSFFILYYEPRISNKLKNYIFSKKNYIIILGGICLFLSREIFISFKETVIFFKFQKITLQKALIDLEINPLKYISKDKIEANKGKNVVIIYLESFEQNWLDKSLFLEKELAPNLKNRIKNKEWTFFSNYISLPGSTWTFGAQYSTLTGVPTYFGFEGNTVFQTIKKYNGVSVGNILEKADYNQVYMNGSSLEFAGHGKMYNFFGFKTYGKDELPKYYLQHEWGIKDKDLFEEAKKKYLELSKREKPFNLTLLTVDSHFPKGYPDERLLEKMPRKDLSSLEYVIKSTDYLLDDFIKFLEKQENYKDTVVYILPDHLLMGSEKLVPEVKNLKQKERKLFFMTNANSLSNMDTKKEISLYDIPILILKGIEVDTNYKFLKELNPNLDIKNENILNKISALNLSLVQDNKKERIFNYIYMNYYLKFKLGFRNLILDSILLRVKRSYEFKKEFKIKNMQKLPKYKFIDEVIYKSGISEQEFLKISLAGGKYIELNLDEDALHRTENQNKIKDIIEILRKYEDIQIILDNFNAIIYLKNLYPDIIDRVIPEVNAKYKYHTAYNLGFKKIIYTLKGDENNTSIEELVDFAEVTSITAVRFSEDLKNSKKLIDKLEKNGINYFTY
ncbi:MAG: sulfatase-like hydrolase/transferase [Cetobacterium sp.]|uniref:sulfatase-like hydrolase/transferase n=1 Tax=Cetobacterium sp. TaxID=2071632 RepID=UPI003F3DA5A9